MSVKQVSLIFDIGKTTKKALVFNNTYDVLEEKNEQFAEITDEDGFPADDFQGISAWVEDTFRYYANHEKYKITHLNFSAYGASLVHLDEADKVIKPFYNYLKPFPEANATEFFSLYNADNALVRRTASPFLGMLNSGLQLFWMCREKRNVFAQVKTSLHFPQYFPFLLTQKKFTDITSIGCHTMLWDFNQSDYHEWVKREQLTNLFPAVQLSNHTFSFSYKNQHIQAGIGVHDSSSALMPYLVTAQQPFLLLSTGTWNICFNPFNPSPLTDEELKKDCLSYLTFEGKPVKASRIFLGHEHEKQQQALATFFGVAMDKYKSIKFDPNIYNKLVHENNPEKLFFPLDMAGSGPIPNKSEKQTNYTVFEKFEEAQHQLMRCLVQWQKISIDLVDPEEKIKDVIIVGGFTKSPLFLEILKQEIKSKRILISDHPRAAALGAAWLATGEYINGRHQQILKVSAC